MNIDDIDTLIGIQIATLNLIGALAEKLTNEKPIVSVELKDKSLLKISPTTESIA